MEKNRTFLGQPVSIGAEVLFGSYEQDNDQDNGKEQILWKVLDAVDGKALLLSKYCLICHPYHTSIYSVSWEDCSLRAWLNNGFFNEAFDKDEKERIVDAQLRNDENPQYGTYAGNDTVDHVFLLSIEEARTFFSCDEERCALSPEYAIAQSTWQSSETGNSWWWLRSPGISTDMAAGINAKGAIRTKGHDVGDAHAAVRPAIWVTLD